MPRLRYFIYCRKSQESEDRQAVSIASQKSEILKKFGADQSVKIIDTFEESMSAKSPGRPIFESMLERIENGEADGVLSWHPDRLSRNSVDAGKIIYLLDLKLIKDLQFAAYTFINTPEGKLMLSTILSFSKYYSDALSKNVKRGLRTKLENGWLPNRAPLGYLNCNKTGTIVADPERFNLVKQIWDHMGMGYTPRMIYEKAYHEWGLRTVITKHRGGRPVSLSNIYRILSNPFYTGLIPWKGQLYHGKHQPMVSLEDFEAIQNHLGRRALKPHTKDTAPRFSYTGMMRCGQCDCAITAENKKNRFGSHYVYYHCTHRKTNYNCKQKSVEVKALEAQIIIFLDSLSISKDVFALLQNEAKNNFETSDNHNKDRIIAIKKELNKNEKRFVILNQMRMNEQIPENEYVEERRKLEFEQEKLRQNLGNLENHKPWFEPFQNYLEFRNQAVSLFKKGDHETKRLILRTAGSNPKIMDRKLTIQAEKPFFTIPNSNGIPELRGVIKDFRKWNGENRADVVNASIQEIHYRAMRTDAANSSLK